MARNHQMETVRLRRDVHSVFLGAHSFHTLFLGAPTWVVNNNLLGTFLLTWEERKKKQKTKGYSCISEWTSRLSTHQRVQSSRSALLCALLPMYCNRSCGYGNTHRQAAQLDYYARMRTHAPKQARRKRTRTVREAFMKAFAVKEGHRAGTGPARLGL